MTTEIINQAPAMGPGKGTVAKEDPYWEFVARTIHQDQQRNHANWEIVQAYWSRIDLKRVPANLVKATNEMESLVKRIRVIITAAPGYSKAVRDAIQDYSSGLQRKEALREYQKQSNRFEAHRKEFNERFPSYEAAMRRTLEARDGRLAEDDGAEEPG